MLGTGCDPWLAAAIVGLNPGGLSVAVEALVAANVLANDGDHSVFIHPVVREAVLAELGPVGRSTLHARAATRLWSAKAAADRVAAHLAQAPRGTLPNAADVLRKAAASLLASGDARTAVAHMIRAVDERPDDAGLRAGDATEARRHLRVAAAASASGRSASATTAGCTWRPGSR